MDWKALLWSYADDRNRMEANYDGAALGIGLDDERYRKLQKERIVRLKEQHEERRLLPLTREIRLRDFRAEPLGSGLKTTLRLHHRFTYSLQGVKHVEERIENERLYLVPYRGGWRIAAIEPDQGDAHPPVSTGGERGPAWGSLIRLGGIPAQPEVVIEKDNRGTGLVHWPNSEFSLSRKAAAYDREKAREYADRYWEKGNPAFLEFEVDCSNYVSQCIFAGGAPMNYTNRRDSGWWYGGMKGNQENWSYSWAVADSLRRYLSASRSSGLRAVRVDTPQELEPGDVISYSWKGDGRYGHSTVVTARDEAGMPLVNAHTVSSKHRYWDYRDSYAWTENARYLFFHITDLF
ncbi:amidase domain-containing protein [Gorillibacterium sp. CAU 1737]|uniref:amidase domain-containing protein n=1 Tax=Gorillibacterium sp. CAU 1737 TaxID=3140362 RepID=UPI00326056C8